MTIYNRPYYTIFFQYRPIILCDTVAAQSTDAMARGFPQSKQSIYSSADDDAIIKGLFSFKVFGHLSVVIKTTFHSFVTLISIYCIGINRAYMYLVRACLFFFLFNKLSLLTVTL